ncbi:MAG: hypothetical protein ACREAE_09920, partial [Nitrosopumilaceae archaeon]
MSKKIRLLWLGWKVSPSPRSPSLLESLNALMIIILFMSAFIALLYEVFTIAIRAFSSDILCVMTTRIAC